MGEDQLSSPHILSRPADVAAPAHLLQDLDLVAIALGPLETDDRVGPSGNRRACHDTHRCAGLDGTLKDKSGCEVPGDAQSHWMIMAGPDDILGTDGVAIHGGVIQGWNIVTREDVLGQHLSQCLQDRHPLRLQRLYQGQHTLLCLFNSEHGVGIG